MIIKFFIDFLLITGTCTCAFLSLKGQFHWGLDSCEGMIERLLSKVDVPDWDSDDREWSYILNLLAFVCF